jgi:polyisoprenoid-binding protein YceI
VPISHASVITLLLVLSVLTAGPVPRAQAVDAWRITTGSITVVCPLTIGGRFEATSTAIDGTVRVDSDGSSALTGSLSVDLSTLDTGIELRNTHLRERYLEVGRGEGYDRAVLTEIALDGGPAATFSGRTRFRGVLTVHGVSRPVTGDARLESTPSGTRVEASFPVHLPAFEIAKPRYLGVGVKDDVEVRVSFEAARSVLQG